MQLSNVTLEILKNFSSINNNLIINPGNQLVTISNQKNIMAKAEVLETFPSQFGIYSLPEFLGAVSLFTEPELTFEEKCVLISSGKNAVKFFAADPSLLTVVPTIKAIPEPDITFDLDKSVLSFIMKSSNILNVPDFSIVGNGTEICVMVGDKSNQTSNVFKSTIGETDKTFRFNMKIENLKVIKESYELSIAAKKMCKLTGKVLPIEYYIALENDDSME